MSIDTSVLKNYGINLIYDKSIAEDVAPCLDPKEKVVDLVRSKELYIQEIATKDGKVRQFEIKKKTFGNKVYNFFSALLFGGLILGWQGETKKKTAEDLSGVFKGEIQVPDEPSKTSITNFHALFTAIVKKDQNKVEFNQLKVSVKKVETPTPQMKAVISVADHVMAAATTAKPVALPASIESAEVHPPVPEAQTEPRQAMQAQAQAQPRTEAPAAASVIETGPAAGTQPANPSTTEQPPKPAESVTGTAPQASQTQAQPPQPAVLPSGGPSVTAQPQQQEGTPLPVPVVSATVASGGQAAAAQPESRVQAQAEEPAEMTAADKAAFKMINEWKAENAISWAPVTIEPAFEQQVLNGVDTGQITSLLDINQPADSKKRVFAFIQGISHFESKNGDEKEIGAKFLLAFRKLPLTEQFSLLAIMSTQKLSVVQGEEAEARLESIISTDPLLGPLFNCMYAKIFPPSALHDRHEDFISNNVFGRLFRDSYQGACIAKAFEERSFDEVENEHLQELRRIAKVTTARVATQTQQPVPPSAVPTQQAQQAAAPAATTPAQPKPLTEAELRTLFRDVTNWREEVTQPAFQDEVLREFTSSQDGRLINSKDLAGSKNRVYAFARGILRYESEDAAIKAQGENFLQAFKKLPLVEQFILCSVIGISKGINSDMYDRENLPETQAQIERCLKGGADNFLSTMLKIVKGIRENTAISLDAPISLYENAFINDASLLIVKDPVLKAMVSSIEEQRTKANVSVKEQNEKMEYDTFFEMCASNGFDQVWMRALNFALISERSAASKRSEAKTVSKPKVIEKYAGVKTKVQEQARDQAIENLAAAAAIGAVQQAKVETAEQRTKEKQEALHAAEKLAAEQLAAAAKEKEKAVALSAAEAQRQATVSAATVRQQQPSAAPAQAAKPKVQPMAAETVPGQPAQQQPPGDLKHLERAKIAGRRAPKKGGGFETPEQIAAKKAAKEKAEKEAEEAAKKAEEALTPEQKAAKAKKEEEAAAAQKQKEAQEAAEKKKRDLIARLAGGRPGGVGGAIQGAIPPSGFQLRKTPGKALPGNTPPGKKT